MTRSTEWKIEIYASEAPAPAPFHVPISTNVCKVSGVRIFKHINTSMTGSRIHALVEHMPHEIRSGRKCLFRIINLNYLLSFQHPRFYIIHRCITFEKVQRYKLCYAHSNTLYFWPVYPSILGNGISSFEWNLTSNTLDAKYTNIRLLSLFHSSQKVNHLQTCVWSSNIVIVW